MAIIRNKLLLGKDINGNVTYELPFTSSGVGVTLAANTAQNAIVPNNVNTVFFSYSSGANVWVDPQNIAVIPGGSFTTTFADLNPVARSVIPGQTLSFISPTAAYVKVSYYNTNLDGL